RGECRVLPADIEPQGQTAAIGRVRAEDAAGRAALVAARGERVPVAGAIVHRGLRHDRHGLTRQEHGTDNRESVQASHPKAPPYGAATCCPRLGRWTGAGLSPCRCHRQMTVRKQPSYRLGGRGGGGTLSSRCYGPASHRYPRKAWAPLLISAPAKSSTAGAIQPSRSMWCSTPAPWDAPRYRRALPPARMRRWSYGTAMRPVMAARA